MFLGYSGGMLPTHFADACLIASFIMIFGLCGHLFCFGASMEHPCKLLYKCKQPTLSILILMQSVGETVIERDLK